MEPSLTSSAEHPQPPGQLSRQASVEQPGNIAAAQIVLQLVQKLCQALDETGIQYCHWKSNNALDRSASGENDLDLLISRSDAVRFSEIIFRLGFKQVQAPPDKEMPAVQNFFGYDFETDRWVHVHAHYQLILGHDMTKNYRLPIEKPYLESCVQDGLFKVPAVEFEFVILIIRLVLKYATWDAIVGREGSMKKSERRELVDLQARIDPQRIEAILKEHLPFIEPVFFNQCVQAMQPGASFWLRVKTGHQLQIRLQANARLPMSVDPFVKFFNRLALAYQRRILKKTTKYHLTTGGAIIAILGGDGAGKTTAIKTVNQWLSKNFETTRIHMGKPAWSVITVTIRSILKLGQVVGLYPLEASFNETIQQTSRISPGYPYLIREVCRARDRYHTYCAARRKTANGGMVIFDRFPVKGIQLMDGPMARRFVEELMRAPGGRQFLSPRTNSRLTMLLVRWEERYYQRIMQPEMRFVLLVEPEVAVRRKTDEEPNSVRERSTEFWNFHWEETGIKVIDSSQPKEKVAEEIKSLIWARL